MTISELIIIHLLDSSAKDTVFLSSDGGKRRLTGGHSIPLYNEYMNNVSSLEQTLFKVKTPTGFATIAWYGDASGFYTDSVEIIK